MCAERGLDGLARSLSGLAGLVAGDLQVIEEELTAVQRADRVMHRAGSYLLGAGGKRIRPMCVALAARVGDGFDRRAADLAVAVELVHNATLLHDDVIDLATTRRGRASARTVFGNAASIFAGDWLLIESLRRVQRAAVPGTLSSLLETIDKMIWAESLQLENRGRFETDLDLYLSIAEGKSASLFRWAMAAGGAAAGLSESQCHALEEYGGHLGMAFQAVDDVLDLSGDEATTGKALFTDLREGKLTHPLLVALQRQPALRPLLQELASVDHEMQLPAQRCADVLAVVEETDALEASRAFARERVEKASLALRQLPKSDATAALAVVAHSIIHRSH
ncbi:MAG: polyprenyl synthetase family protein [Acidobacteria bacterium]|nr:MAG: polyprenyl synthetase family protein [Acidobacteriota bacterium]REK07400.1 MAG: polyprenyl synthetase family protein [Acidobacteriota bacterium]